MTNGRIKLVATILSLLPFVSQKMQHDQIEDTQIVLRNDGKNTHKKQKVNEKSKRSSNKDRINQNK